MTAAAAATVVAAAPGVASKAMALGVAAASATASAAGNAFDHVRDFAAERLKGSHFSEADVVQAAGAIELLQLGVRSEDGTFRMLTEAERLQMSRVVLAATLEDDPEKAVEEDVGQD